MKKLGIFALNAALPPIVVPLTLFGVAGACAVAVSTVCLAALDGFFKGLTR